MSYKAFISYSHAADNLLAPALQSALHRFAKPFYRLRAVRVFRDKTSLHLTPELWPLIQSALKDSEYFILLASPDAAQSQWVQAEIKEWLTLRHDSVERLLIVQTGGEIEWDDAAGDFDWSKTTALPPSLQGAFKREPLYLDLRWARASTDLSLRNPQFLDDVGTLGAALHGKSKDELIGNDVRQHRLFKAVAAVVAVLLLALAISASGAAVYANRQRKEAERQTAEAKKQRKEAERQTAEAKKQKKNAETAAEQERVAAENERIARKQAEERRLEADRQRQIADEKRREAEQQNHLATSRELAANAMSQVSIDPELSVLLSIQAEGVTHTAESEDALRHSVLASRVRHTIQSYTWMDDVAFSPDGRWLVVVSDRAQVLEAGTWKVVAELSGDGAPVHSVSFSRDGTLVLTSSTAGFSMTDSVARLWQAGSWRKIAEFRGKIGGAPKAALSPDGKLLAMWSSSEKAQVWETAGRSVIELGDQGDRVEGVTFSPDSKLMVVTGRTGSKEVGRLLEAATGRLVLDLGTNVWPLASPAFSPDGKYLALAYQSTARVFDLEKGTAAGELGDSVTLNGMAFSPDGRWLVTASKDYRARVWEVGRWQAVAELRGHTGEVLGVAFSSNGKTLVTSSKDFTARLWAVDTWKSLGVLSGHKQPLLAAAISPGGEYVATTSQDSSTRIWAVNAGRDMLEIPGSPEIGGGAFFPQAFSPDGKLVVVENGNYKSVDVLDVISGRKVTSLAAYMFLAFSPDGKYLFTADSKHVIHQWETGTWHRVATLRGHEKEILSLAFSPDGKRIVTAGGYDETARVWDLATGQSVAVLHGHTGRVMRAVFSPDGRWIATASFDHTARLWQTASWKPAAVLRGHTAEVWSVACSPDSRLLLTGSYDGSARLWEVGTGSSVRVLQGHASYVQEAILSPDGKRAVTLGFDRTARLWDTETGKTLAVLRGDSLPHAAFSRDGKLLATVSGTTASLLDASTGKSVSALQVVPPGAGLSGSREREPTGVNFSPDGTLLLTAWNDGLTRILSWELFAPLEDLLAVAHMRATRALTPEEQVKYLHKVPKKDRSRAVILESGRQESYPGRRERDSAVRMRS